MNEATPNTGPDAGPKPKRIPKEATLTGRRRLSPELIRLTFDVPELAGVELPFTDHYVKLLFAPAGADYRWPFDPAEIAASRPRAEQPVTRTYTLRSHDPATGAVEIDFVAHGSEGLAGPWAQRAEIGERIGFLGPGGAWAPDPSYEHFILAGDEAAAPAIFAALEQLPAGATATAYVEIAEPESLFDAPAGAGIEVNWVPRAGAIHGTRLIEAVRAGGHPEKRTSWFIHGVAEMVKETRRFLFVEGEVAKADASISGYWRLGMTEDQWQASKREFTALSEAEEQAARRG